MAAESRFADVSDEFLDELLDKSIPQKTKKAIKYVMKVFNGKKTMKTKKMVHILRVLIHGMSMFSSEIFVYIFVNWTKFIKKELQNDSQAKRISQRQ